MQPTSTAAVRFVNSILPTLSILLLGLILGGCAGVATAPVATSPSDALPTPGTAVASDEEALADSAREAGGEAEQPLPTQETVEVVPEGEGHAPADDGEAQAAEEVEPSPLDQLPETAPEVSDAVIARDKSLVAEAAPKFDMPMVMNDKVVGYVEYFSGRHKAFFEASLVRSGRYVETFRAIFAEAGIPTDLVYMAHVESAFKTNAYSRAKAKGIFQFIAGTGRRYGLRIDSWIDERSDPEKSARAAAAYLKDLYGMFGDWYLALAAYNAGEGKIQRSLGQTRKSDFWSLASTRSLRPETRNYVPAILAATLIAKQPKTFGFDVDPDDPVATEVVAIDGQTDLRILARLAGVADETVRQLNPQIRRGVTPPHGTTDVRVPAGLGDALREAYAALPAADRMIIARHQVSKGESVAAIARHYGVPSSSIARANGLGKETKLQAGRELVIPAVAAPSREPDTSRTRAVAYRVKRGDTLGAIARRYRTTPAAIAAASGVSVKAPIRIGQRLVIPARKGSAGAATVARTSPRTPPAPPSTEGGATPVVHTVRRGETLYRIAGRYQVTVDQICALNKISPNGVLYPGTRLKIRTN